MIMRGLPSLTDTSLSDLQQGIVPPNPGLQPFGQHTRVAWSNSLYSLQGPRSFCDQACRALVPPFSYRDWTGHCEGPESLRSQSGGRDSDQCRPGQPRQRGKAHSSASPGPAPHTQGYIRRCLEQCLRPLMSPTVSRDRACVCGPG